MSLIYDHCIHCPGSHLEMGGGHDVPCRYCPRGGEGTVPINSDRSSEEEERKVIRDRLDLAHRGVNKARSILKQAQAVVDNVKDDCKHPAAVTGSHMGESCNHCPDCEAHDI